MIKLLAALMFALCLAACESDADRSDTKSVEQGWTEASDLTSPTPKSVITAVKNIQTIDGTITQDAVGTFRIDESTLLCKIDGSAGLSTEARLDLFSAIDQPYSNSSGSEREVPFEKYDKCRRKDAILIKSFQSDSRSEGYKITIAIWQGANVYWVGTIARRDRIHPRVKSMPPPIDGNPLSVVGGSMSMDFRELSDRFVEYVTSKSTI